NRWFALHATRDEHDRDDLTAETFAQALLGLQRFRPGDADSAGAWLFAIARNLARQYHRRRRVADSARRRLGMPLDRAAEVLDDAAERVLVASLQPALGRALDRLPRDQRQAVELRVVHELDYRRVARELDCSEPAARTRVHRGLRELQAILGSSAEGTT